MPPAIGEHEAPLIGVAPGVFGLRPFQDQALEGADVELGQWTGLAGEIAHIGDGVVVIDRLQMVLQRLAADGDPLLAHQHRFRRAERVPLDRVGGIGQFEIDDVFQIPQPLGGRGGGGGRVPPFGRRCCGGGCSRCQALGADVSCSECRGWETDVLSLTGRAIVAWLVPGVRIPPTARASLNKTIRHAIVLRQ
jgi:hypothetical protein